MSAQNLTLLTDLYELTMMQGYFESQATKRSFRRVFREIQTRADTLSWPV